MDTTMGLIPQAFSDSTSILASLNTSENVAAGLDTLNACFQTIQGGSRCCREVVGTLFENVTSLTRTEGKLKRDREESKRRLKRVKLYTEPFENSAKDLVVCADIDEETASKIKDEAKKNNFDPLNDHTRKIRILLKKCKQRYDEFEKKFKEAKSLCDEIFEETDDAIAVAKYRKLIARIIKNIGIGMAIISSVGGSVAAGNSHSDLAIALFMVAILGVGIAWIMWSMLNYYTATIIAFDEFNETMRKINNDLDDTGYNMEEIQQRVVTNVKDRNFAVRVHSKSRNFNKQMQTAYGTLQDVAKESRQCLAEQVTLRRRAQLRDNTTSNTTH